ncbi:hypothetical protein BG011_008106 [Mortierella polycephala]|uniref:Uncharacterized protein n=1 Tax=Mortierella polycephala TaxID=41804 RepID=A0A9P6PPM0_9FUNG|nr:hypothetical protein BG011_008106 [Mortierella polycephala]
MQTILIDPVEYAQWFKSETQSPSCTPLPFVSSHRKNIATATRVGIRAFTLAFAAGSLFDVILPAILKRRFNGILRRMMTNASSFGLGACAGSFALLYKLVFRHISHLISKHVSPPAAGNTVDTADAAQIHEKVLTKFLPAIAAALIASPAFTFIPQQSRRLALALYLLTYAGEVVYAALEHAGYMAWMPKWLGLWILIPIGCSQYTHTFLHHPDCCPPTLIKAITGNSSPYISRPPSFDATTFGPFPSTGSVVVGMINSSRAAKGSMPILTPLSVAAARSTSLAGTFLVPEACGNILKATEGMGHNSVTCQLFHPEDGSCLGAMSKFMKRMMMVNISLYSTLTALSFLMKGGQVPSAGHYLNGFLGGLWMLLDAPKRQATIALYFTRFMIECVWRRLVKAGYARNIRYGDVLLFGGSMAAIMGIFETVPAAQHKKSLVQSALTTIFVD